MVACPSIIRFALQETDIFHIRPAENLFLYLVRFRGYDQQCLPRGYFASNGYKTFLHFVQHIGPVCTRMRPCKLYAALQSPFGRQVGGTCLYLKSHILAKTHLTVLLCGTTQRKSYKISHIIYLF